MPENTNNKKVVNGLENPKINDFLKHLKSVPAPEYLRDGKRQAKQEIAKIVKGLSAIFDDEILQKTLELLTYNNIDDKKYNTLKMMNKRLKELVTFLEIEYNEHVISYNENKLKEYKNCIKSLKDLKNLNKKYTKIEPILPSTIPEINNYYNSIKRE
ncbi:MAG: hypothetical protein ACP5UN_03215 [Candidatus Micrarchaeia archaeon]